MLEGWKCPECGRINAPFVDHCPCKDVFKTNYSQFIPIPINPYPYYPTWPWDGTIVVTCKDNNTVNYSVTSNNKKE